MSDKFEDCRYCQHRRTDVCEDCDYGEQFEHVDDEALELDFDRLQMRKKVAA